MLPGTDWSVVAVKILPTPTQQPTTENDSIKNVRGKCHILFFQSVCSVTASFTFSSISCRCFDNGERDGEGRICKPQETPSVDTSKTNECLDTFLPGPRFTSGILRVLPPVPKNAHHLKIAHAMLMSIQHWPSALCLVLSAGRPHLYVWKLEKEKGHGVTT